MPSSARHGRAGLCAFPRPARVLHRAEVHAQTAALNYVPCRGRSFESRCATSLPSCLSCFCLYPQEAREIFIRQALLTGEINTRAGFVERNLAMLRKATEEEAKQRRAGLIADEDWQARWYLDRLPPELYSG